MYLYPVPNMDYALINLPTSTTCSTSRLLYPNSLSYQAKTLTMSPSTTWVRDKSTIADSLLPTMSEETKGSDDTARIPFILPEASDKALLISSTVVGFSSKNVKSEIEPQITGTLSATPSNLPFKVGIASVVAIAAPVVVGIMLV